MSRYGVASRKMLSFLKDNPGSTAREISEYLCNNQIIDQMYVRYRNVWKANVGNVYESWFPKKYVLDSMMSSEYYQDVEILDERSRALSKICRGKYAYLTSPYCSRTLAADPLGSRTHPGAANRNSQRRWFWRIKHDGVYRYFLTMRGMGAVEEHGYITEDNF